MPPRTETLVEIRADLEAVLHRLDEAGMAHAAAYVSMALDLLDRRPEEPRTPAEGKWV
jgi:hypothetical protein